MTNELKPCPICGAKAFVHHDIVDGFGECPFCGHATNCEDDIDELHYCFYCGAKMESEGSGA